MKFCPRCGIKQPKKNFSNDKSRKDKIACWCKDCCKQWAKDNKELIYNYKQKYYKENYKELQAKHKKYYDDNRLEILKKTKQYVMGHPEVIKNTVLKRKFGITIVDFNKLIKKQNNKCAICGKKESVIDYRTKKVYALSVDHNHKTGKVRELLCTRCNNLLGRCQDDINLLKKVIRYLKRNK